MVQGATAPIGFIMEIEAIDNLTEDRVTMEGFNIGSK
jgi:hypothetical protein